MIVGTGSDSHSYSLFLEAFSGGSEVAESLLGPARLSLVTHLVVDLGVGAGSWVLSDVVVVAEPARGALVFEEFYLERYS